jgi:hypothetical protein
VTPDADATSEHLDLDTLADLDESLRPADEVAAAEAHLSGCRTCREQQARLRSTRALLAALPAEPMPPDVADRVHDALSRTTSTTVLPLADDLAGRRWRWRSRPTLAGLGAAAAVVALVGAVVVGSTRSSTTDDNEPSTAAVPGADSVGAVPDHFPITITGRNYTTANAQRLVGRLLSNPASASATPDASTADGAESQQIQPQLPPVLEPLYTSQEALLSCVAALSVGGDPRLPLTVDFGTFSDKTRKLHKVPAVVVVLPSTDARADGWIVGPACATAPDNNIYLIERVPVG